LIEEGKDGGELHRTPLSAASNSSPGTVQVERPGIFQKVLRRLLREAAILGALAALVAVGLPLLHHDWPVGGVIVAAYAICALIDTLLAGARTGKSAGVGSLR